jgi:hypothetical protein
MPRSTAPKESSPQPDPVSLINPESNVPQHGPSKEIVIGKVERREPPAPAPTPVVTTDKDGNITIK